MTDAPPSAMAQAMAAARAAGEAGEVPVGAALVRDGAVIAVAGNRTIRDRDPTAHAEVVVMRMAAKRLGNHRLTGCDLHVTLEPCAMCAGAISFARIANLYWGCDDPKGGAVVSGPRFFAQPTCHHRPGTMLGGAMADESSALLRGFFAARRGRKIATTAVVDGNLVAVDETPDA